MNVDFDPAAVIGFLRRMVSELREKRLWPAAVALLVAIVAVPMALSKSSAATPVAQAPRSTPPPLPGTSLPALNVQSTPAQSRLTGSARDPFSQQRTGTSSNTSQPAVTAVASASAAVATAAKAAGIANGGTGSSTSATTTTSTTTTSTTTPTTITPNAKPTPTTTALSATQSYHVTLAVTNSSGGLDTVDPLERLSVVPSEQQPMLVELGVLKGGHRVLFVVQRGTVVNGPGICTPGPIDCEILSLGQDQTEAVAVQSSTGVVEGPLFAVTAIKTDEQPSAAAADKVRRMESAAGRALLNESTLSALSLFHYDPSLGAVVDLRNLTIGGGG
jgi:hypothetical protein